MMDTTPPDVTEVPHVHGMQIRDLPGFYNSSCGPFSDSTCISQLNLWCVDGLCVCIDNYIPDGSGGCRADMITLMVMSVIRLFVCASIFVFCLFSFHMIVSRRCWCRRTSSRGSAEGEAEEGRRGSQDTCWDDEPPPYLEVAEEAPPPTYLEAVAKERLCNDSPTRRDSASTPPPPVPAREGEGLEASTIPPQPLPSPPDPTPPQALHM